MTPENELNLMRTIISIEGKIDMLTKSVENINPRIADVERKLNRYTGLMAGMGAVILFFKDRIISVFNA